MQIFRRKNAEKVQKSAILHKKGTFFALITLKVPTY